MMKSPAERETPGGSNVANAGLVQAQSEPMHGEPQSLELVLPPLATALFRAEM
jgi:1,4-alpha-glucan branching enzyme